MTGPRPRNPRILRVAELIDAELSAVASRTQTLPAGLTAAVAEVPAGTLLTLELQRGRWDHRPRRMVLNRLERTLREIERDTAQVTIAAAALISGGTVLVARRSHPAELAGQWEFPGGKAERGESAERAIVRECLEELGCRIEVVAVIARQRLDTGATLVLLAARLAARSPAPAALEHLELRWAWPDELDGLDWVSTNRQFVADVTARL